MSRIDPSAVNSFPISEEYHIRHANLPAETPRLQEISTLAFGQGSLFARDEDASQEFQDFQMIVRKTRQRNLIEGRGCDGQSRIGKLIDPNGEIVGYVGMRSPRIDGLQDPLSGNLIDEGTVIPPGGQEILDRAKRNDAAFEQMAESLMHKDRDVCWWRLTILAIAPGHQGKALGGRLVRWGIDQAREARKTDSKIKGVWLIAADTALKTYTKQGMVAHGSQMMDASKNLSYTVMTYNFEHEAN